MTDAPLRKQSPSHERLTTAVSTAVSLVESTSLLIDGLQSTATSNDNAYNRQKVMHSTYSD